MTGGQMAPTTLIGTEDHHDAVRPHFCNEGYPLRSQRAAGHAGSTRLHRTRGVRRQSRDRRTPTAPFARRLENQVKGLGFSLIEVLSPCPTVWKMDPVEAQHWVRDEMTKTYPSEFFAIAPKPRRRGPNPAPPPPLERMPEILGSATVPVEPE